MMSWLSPLYLMIVVAEQTRITRKVKLSFGGFEQQIVTISQDLEALTSYTIGQGFRSCSRHQSLLFVITTWSPPVS
jgi:hypothetical protein